MLKRGIFVSVSQKIGERIKFFRRQRHLSLEEFSKLILKSPSTLSKYESGKIVLDIETLFEIADALNITVNQLVDFDRSVAPTNTNFLSSGNFFQQSDLFYMYSYFGVDKKFYVCALKIVKDKYETGKASDKIILYYDIESTKNYSKSAFIYYGSINYYDSHVTMRLDNPHNVSDQIYIYAKSPFHTHGTSNGLLLGLSESLRSPTSFKVIFSLSPLKEDSKLKSELTISTRDILSEIRRTNCLLIY